MHKKLEREIISNAAFKSYLAKIEHYLMFQSPPCKTFNYRDIFIAYQLSHIAQINHLNCPTLNSRTRMFPSRYSHQPPASNCIALHRKSRSKISCSSRAADPCDESQAQSTTTVHVDLNSVIKSALIPVPVLLAVITSFDIDHSPVFLRNLRAMFFKFVPTSGHLKLHQASYLLKAGYFFFLLSLFQVQVKWIWGGLTISGQLSNLSQSSSSL